MPSKVTGQKRHSRRHGIRLQTLPRWLKQRALLLALLAGVTEDMLTCLQTQKAFPG